MLISALEKQISAVEGQYERSNHDRGHRNNTCLVELAGQEQDSKTNESFENRCASGKCAQFLDLLRLSLLRSAIKAFFPSLENTTSLTEFVSVQEACRFSKRLGKRFTISATS